MGHRIEEIDPRTATESLLGDLHRYYIEHDAELLPDDPPIPYQQRVSDWQNIPDHRIVRRWALWEGDSIAAVAVAVMERHEDLNNGYGRIHVRPESRLRGLATELAPVVLDVLEEAGRRSIITNVPDGVAWESKLSQLGLKRSFQDKRSRLIVSKLDWALMGRWETMAAERAVDYALLYLTTPIPEEHVKRWCEVMEVMNTAPREDLDFDDTTWTPDKWRETEAKDLAAGHELMAHVVVENTSGDFVGLSEIIYQRHQPDLAWQGDTGVHPDHRNRGLGRWLKAATIRKVLGEHSEITRIDTSNAGSNAPMLKINIEMGYKPIQLTNAWQGDLATVRGRLGA